MKNTALVIIDMQNAYFNNDALAKQKSELMERINELIDTATKQSVPVFNVVTEHERDRSTWTLNMLDDGAGYLCRDDADSETVAGLDVGNARTIIKTRDSAFFGTDFADQLAKNDIDSLVICGVSTHGCIMQTAADAYAHNLRVILAREAIATHDPTYHETTLALLVQEYRQELLSNNEILNRMTL